MVDKAHDLLTLPDDLPAPIDDGAAEGLLGSAVPDIVLPSTSGGSVSLARLGAGRTIVYAYPRTGRPGEEPLTPDWDRIPGARGCTPEACGFRDHHAELERLGAQVYGLSTQSSEYQRELVHRLRLPYAVLSDADLRLTAAWGLPTFEVGGQTLLRRLTLVIRNGKVEHLWYPVFPPDRHAEAVEGWLRTKTL